MQDTLPPAPYEPVRRAAAWYALGGGILVAAIVARLAWYPVITSDYLYFVQPWAADLAGHPGLSSFVHPFADYAPLYLYFLKVLAYVPFPLLYVEKTFSLLFDAVIAFAAYRILEKSRWQARPDIRFLAASVYFALPTVMMNSSLWGQSDALYGAGVLLSLASLIRAAPFLAAVWFGIALSFKVQAVFFAPVLAGYLLRSRRTARYLFVPPAIFLATVLPAWFAGGNLWYWLFIYAKQAGEYPYLSLSAQSVFAFVEPYALSPLAVSALFWAGIAAAAAAAAWAASLAYRNHGLPAASLVRASFVAALLIPYLLPRMHERYFYLADLFAVLYAFYEPDRFIVAILVVFASAISYLPFLSSQVGFLSTFHVDLRIPAALLLIPMGYVLVDLYRRRPVRLVEPA